MAHDERNLPASLESERALLGGLILDPEQADAVSELVRSDDFRRPEHAALYRLLVEMRSQGAHVDLVSVTERVMRGDADGEYGGLAYVLSLPEQVPSTSNLRHYAQIVRDKAVARQVILKAYEITDKAFSASAEPDVLVESAAQAFLQIGQGGGRQWEQVSVVVDQELTRIERVGEQGGDVTGITTGYVDLNKKLNGWQATDLVILAARPAMGKTALALNFAINAAIEGGRAVGLFSLEMSRGQLVGRLLSLLSMVEAGKLRTGKLTPEEWDRLLEAGELLRQQRVFIDDTPGVRISDVRARARRLKAQHPDLGLLVIDYLQLMQGDDAKAPRQQQISDISRGLKILAKDLEVPVLALSQLNRGVEQRQEKRPMVSDLRESGAIEQDADIILFIYRDEVYNESTADRGVAELIIAKQRSGPTGTVKLAFQKEYTRFDNLAEAEVAILA
jgi:replicative DNA helicase